jgi:hypothetical protein
MREFDALWANGKGRSGRSSAPKYLEFPVEGASDWKLNAPFGCVLSKEASGPRIDTAQACTASAVMCGGA